jgi:hypothetical protein
MADSFTTNLRLLKQTDQGNVNIWGSNYNEGVIDLTEAAIAGRADIDVTFANVVLTMANGAPDTSRPMFLRVTGLPGGTRTITVPALNKLYIVSNLTSDSSSIEVRTVANPGYTINPGQTVMLAVNAVSSGLVQTPFEEARIVTAAALPATTVSFNINNATAGDTVVTATFLKQGAIIHCILPAISTTISSSDFILTPQATVPTELLPFPLDAEHSICIEQAGIPAFSYLHIDASISAPWEFFKTDGSAMAAAVLKETKYPFTFLYHRAVSV